MADLFSEIVNRCKRGDRKAQEAIYNLLAGKMYTICLRYCNSKEEAQDVLHDGFITIFTKIKQFQHAGSFEGWVRRIIVNQALERYRNNMKGPVIERVEDVSWQVVTPEAEEEWEANNLSEDELLSMIQELPQQYKIVFNMYVLDGLSHKEISEMLGIAESTSRSNLLRARSILQKQINELISSISNKKNANRQQSY